MALLSLHLTRRKVRCISLPPSLDACAKGSVYLCSYHAGGSTYCGVGALSLLGKWPISSRGSFTSHDRADDKRKLSAEAMWDTIRYLVYRQVPFHGQKDEESEESDIQTLGQEVQHMQVSLTQLSASKAIASHPTSSSNASTPPTLSIYAGLNGRCNKVADTCYLWWAGGSLSVSLSCEDI